MTGGEKMQIGEKIKLLRIANEMTQQDLGEILGVNKATIQKYECGNIQNLKTSHIKKLCDVFNKQPNFFFFEYDDLPVNHDLDKLIIFIEHYYGKSAANIFENCLLLDDKNKNKLLDAHLNDKIETATYYKKYDELHDLIKQAEKDEQPKPKKDFSAIEEFLKLDLNEIYYTLTPLERRRLWLSIIREIRIERNIVDIEFL